ncbi:hypothetical protein EMPG_13288, partial [Blastomyces silverae]
MPTSTLRFSPRFLPSSTPSTLRLRAANRYSQRPNLSPARMSSGTAAALARNARAERIRNPALLITTTTKLLKAAKPLNIPIYITTQNRARLGATVSEFNPYLDPAINPNVRADLDKTLFSMVTPELKACFPTAADDGQQVPLDAII